jgi:hypothetical protein
MGPGSQSGSQTLRTALHSGELQRSLPLSAGLLITAACDPFIAAGLITWRHVINELDQQADSNVDGNPMDD